MKCQTIFFFLKLKKEKYFKMLSAEIFNPACRAIDISWNFYIIFSRA